MWASLQDGLIQSNSWFLFPLGLFVVIRITLFTLRSIIYFWTVHIRIHLEERENMKKKYGPWAIVTGCTSGIGEQFAKELASLGMNVVLASRSLDKLNKQANEIEKQYGVKTKVVACNFLERDSYKKAADVTKGMDIGLLVNNVGLNTDTGSRRFEEMTVQEVRDMTVVNTGASTLMTKVVLQDMINRGRGCVLNIGSTSGYDYLPSQALYCATKCYMRMKTLAIDKEVSGTGVTIRCNLPQFVRTSMCEGNSFIYNLPMWTCDPKQYAKSSILTMDTPETGGWWFFDLMIGFIDVLKLNILTRDALAYLAHLLVDCFLVKYSTTKESKKV